MPRRFAENRLVVASHNAGKIREITELLVPFGLDVTSAAALELNEPEETGASFIANAELKARAAARVSGLVALADDSGLVVPALGGEPGIRSDRWAGPGRDFGLAMARTERALAERGEEGDRRAHFAAALSLAWPDGHCESFEGEVSGHLVWPPRGERGFGYDPMFVADGHTLTFGEMDPADKHRISHRSDAFRKLIDACLRAR